MCKVTIEPVLRTGLLPSRNLRYKDYQLVAPASICKECFAASKYGSLEEISTVKAMATEMEKHALSAWWRKAMGFAGSD